MELSFYELTRAKRNTVGAEGFHVVSIVLGVAGDVELTSNLAGYCVHCYFKDPHFLI